MLIQLRPNMSISKVVQILKGGSSKKIRKEFPKLKELLWGNNFWAEGYFFETVGKVNLNVVRDYIRNQ